MNVIITEIREHDARFADEAIRNRLGLNDSWLVVSAKELAQNNYSIPKTDVLQWDKCVLLTEYNSGFLLHHKLLIQHFPARYWCFVVFGAEEPKVQAELKQQALLKAAQCTNNIFTVVFDDADTLDQTKIVLNHPLNDKYTCAVLSRNASCAQTMIELLEQLVDGNFCHVSNATDDRLNSADALILAGCSWEDFLPAQPATAHMLHMAVWHDKSMAGMTTHEKDDYTYFLVKYLNELGWDREACRNALFCGTIYNEKCGWNWKNGNISTVRLLSDEQFVLWDRYGLPCSSRDYDQAHLEEFFNRVCLIDKLVQQMGMPKK